jgi:hypothetical protein
MFSYLNNKFTLIHGCLLVLTYKEEPAEELIDIVLSMGCEYMFKYQGLIEQFVSSYFNVIK